jgi:hypothetical protein
MRAAAKFGLVAAGYVGAFVLAAGSVAIYAAWADSPDRQASSGMYAFGDSLLFLALFGLASVPPTVAGLFFLRPYHSFWRVLAIAALVTPPPAWPRWVCASPPERQTSGLPFNRGPPSRCFGSFSPRSSPLLSFSRAHSLHFVRPEWRCVRPQSWKLWSSPSG